MAQAPDEIKKGLPLYTPEEIKEILQQKWTIHSHEKLYRSALALIQQLEAQVPRWISVDESLPEKGVYKACLAYANGFIVVAEWSCNKFGYDWWFHVDGEYEPLVTHWMPLPEPPKEETK